MLESSKGPDSGVRFEVGKGCEGLIGNEDV